MGTIMFDTLKVCTFESNSRIKFIINYLYHEKNNNIGITANMLYH